MERVMIISLGCPKNTVDSEIMSAIAENSGYEITTEALTADIAVVNTCAFIEPAVEEAISTILETAELKEKGLLKKLIVAGCLTERYREKIINDIPEVDLCIGVDGIPLLGKFLKENKQGVITGDLDSIDFLNLDRKLSEGGGTAYVKISDGCDNTCTYCMIPSIRGKMRSRTIEDISSEVLGLCNNSGINEIILVAQDTTAYGMDIYGKLALTDLLRELVKVEKLKWIRMLYCYPELITDELINLMANEDKIVNYLDIPFQHASDHILKLMGRSGTLNDYNILIEKLRDRLPDIIIRTTFITGFPGENDKDFKILQSFIEKSEFGRVGIFTYYDEDGAASYKLPDKIEFEVSSGRRDVLMSIQKEISFQLNEKRVQKIYDIMIGDVSDDGIFYEGRSYGEAPEIDGIVYVACAQPLNRGDMVPVKILEARDYDLIGEAII
ncbi:MAG: 30S ribosomal protein S12 methylthiotransferase RimO [Clostridiales bacterium]|nr:30S ribosomal protein S12 methylthiotransferase RimO [Clostridiales bacterium]